MLEREALGRVAKIVPSSILAEPEAWRRVCVRKLWKAKWFGAVDEECGRAVVGGQVVLEMQRH